MVSFFVNLSEFQTICRKLPKICQNIWKLSKDPKVIRIYNFLTWLPPRVIQLETCSVVKHISSPPACKWMNVGIFLLFCNLEAPLHSFRYGFRWKRQNDHIGKSFLRGTFECWHRGNSLCQFVKKLAHYEGRVTHSDKSSQTTNNLIETSDLLTIDPRCSITSNVLVHLDWPLGTFISSNQYKMESFVKLISSHKHRKIEQFPGWYSIKLNNNQCRGRFAVGNGYLSHIIFIFSCSARFFTPRLKKNILKYHAGEWWLYFHNNIIFRCNKNSALISSTFILWCNSAHRAIIIKLFFHTMNTMWGFTELRSGSLLIVHN